MHFINSLYFSILLPLHVTSNSHTLISCHPSLRSRLRKIVWFRAPFMYNLRARSYIKQLATQRKLVPLSEQMGLNVLVHTEETRRKRQRNWQATRNLQLLQSRHAVNQLPVSRCFLLAYPSLPTPFYSRFSTSEVFLVISMELYILAFQKDWLVYVV